MADVAKQKIELVTREGLVISSLIRLPDDSGYWLFGDSTRIAWATGLGTPIVLKDRVQKVTQR